MEDERSTEEQMREMDQGLAFYYEMVGAGTKSEPMIDLNPDGDDPNAAGDWLAADYGQTGVV